MLLLTGASGTTTPSVVALAASRSTPYLVASRRSSSKPHTVVFDFTSPDTWDTALSHSPSAIYLVLPPVHDAPKHVNGFVSAAAKKGVKRFVLCAGSSVVKGQGPMGEVWAHLASLGVEYSVMKPSWFLDNLLGGRGVIIMDKRTIYSATQGAKTGFQAAEDIAAVAYWALTCKKEDLKEEVDINGPEVLSYDEVAKRLTEKLGREFTHVKIDKDDLIKRHMAAGMPEPVAGFMAYLEERTAEGKDKQAPTQAVEKLTGGKGVTLDQFIEKHRDEFP